MVCQRSWRAWMRVCCCSRVARRVSRFICGNSYEKCAVGPLSLALPDAHPRHIQGRIAYQMDEGVAIGQYEQDGRKNQPGAPAIENRRPLLRTRERFRKGGGLGCRGV